MGAVVRRCCVNGSFPGTLGGCVPHPLAWNMLLWSCGLEGYIAATDSSEVPTHSLEKDRGSSSGEHVLHFSCGVMHRSALCEHVLQFMS